MNAIEYHEDYLGKIENLEKIGNLENLGKRNKARKNIQQKAVNTVNTEVDGVDAI